MAELVSFHRAKATSPGKHGPKDWRVTLSGVAPEHSELIFILGMVLIAEDRYPDWGRHMLWYFIDRLQAAKSAEAVLAIAEDCQDAKDTPLKKVVVA